MAKDPFERFEVPNEMRALAEQSMTQARKAFDGFISAASQAVATLHGQATSAQNGARDVTQKSMAFAEQNVAASFEFAQRLVRAKDPEEVMKLQSEYLNQQMKVLAEQAQELGQSTGKVIKESAKPKA
jgi:phasin